MLSFIVSGVDTYVTTLGLCLICIFYTFAGGFKGVVFADTIQLLIMVGSSIFIAVKGTSSVGGVEVVWERNINSTRIEVPS